MLNYHQYEEAVYNELLREHANDNSFTFSVRQNAIKGAEKDYFIGTEKGKYFATTFWQIRTGYPGSSGDLIDVFFTYTSDSQLTYYIEFNQTKKPFNDQNKYALNLIQSLEPKVEQALGLKRKSNPAQKAHSYSTKSRQPAYKSVSEMIGDVILDYKTLLPLVNDEISRIKAQYPLFEAQQITKEEFDKMQDKLRARLDLPTIKRANQDAATYAETKIRREATFPLNQILFGPPGTGKTYNTINKALEIIDDDEVKAVDRNDRTKVKTLFDRKLKEGQIVFSTFHQSMSYEEFIEGIKPLEPNTENNPGDELTYRVTPGILKKLVGLIHDEQQVTQNNLYIPEEYFTDYVIKMSLGSVNEPRDKDIYDYCISSNQMALGFGFNVDFTGVKDRSEVIKRLTDSGYQLEGKRDFTVDALERFIFWAVKGRMVIVSNGLKKVRAIGVITGDYQYNPSAPIRFHHFKTVKWLHKNIDLDVSTFYDKQLMQQSIYAIDKDYINKDIFIKKGANATNKNYVLIIDEINRGNVSQIFGELITLIEADKRQGKPEALEVTLPYSKEQFSVPPNLYIIGTMNTADRSVEALDTALRRRFSFTEMPPRADLLTPTLMLQRLWKKYEHLEWTDEEWKKNEDNFLSLLDGEILSRSKYEKLEEDNTLEEQVEEFKLAIQFRGIAMMDLLTTINKRIEVLLDRDHQIGHSYFFNVTSWKELEETFYRNIIPLLQEYFFGDYAKIGAVLGQGFIRNKANTGEENIFADFDDFEAGDFMDKPVYEIVDYRNSSTQHSIKKGNKNIKMDFQMAIQELMRKLNIPKDDAES
jgi:5-methylcytosine-specific restriction protein B